MGFDIQNLHIPDDSIAAKVIESIVEAEHVSPARAVQLALERLGEERLPIGFKRKVGARSPVVPGNPEAMFGMFADTPGFGEVMDEIVAKRNERYS